MLSVVRDQTITATFRSDDATATAIKDAMETAARAMLTDATDDDREALFRLGCERLIVREAA
jgi:hypothetical protein